MNERIEKLLAELDIDLYTDEGVMMTGILVRPKDLRQFAELIVRECIDVGIKDFYNHLPNIFPANAIKKHFGVKE